jgi:hypothetical protein
MKERRKEQGARRKEQGEWRWGLDEAEPRSFYFYRLCLFYQV